MPLFLFIFEICTVNTAQSFYHIHTVHSSVAICWSSSPFPHCWSAQWVKPPCGAEPSIKLRPALQQADALPAELRRTLLSYAAPYWATPHPNELRRTLNELYRTLLTYATPFRAMPHPNWATLHPAELCCSLTELCRTLTELLQTLLRYATPFRAMPHPNWAIPHPTELCRILLSYTTP